MSRNKNKPPEKPKDIIGLTRGGTNPPTKQELPPPPKAPPPKKK